MITFSREGTKIAVKIRTGLYAAGHQELTAYIECNNTLFADLLEKQLEDNFDKVTRQVRKLEYERGRRRNKKQNYFYYGLGTDSYPKNE